MHVMRLLGTVRSSVSYFWKRPGWRPVNGINLLFSVQSI